MLTVVRQHDGADGPVEQRTTRSDVPLPSCPRPSPRTSRSRATRATGRAAPRRGRRAAAPAAGRSGDRRHPGRRRAELGARRGDDGRAAHRGRRAARLRRLAGVHGPRAGVPRRAVRLCPNVACVLTKTDLLPGVAAHRRARPRAPAHRRASTPTCSRCRRTRALAGGDDAATPTSTPSRASPSWWSTSPAGARARPTCSARRSTVHDVLAVTEQICDSPAAPSGPRAATRRAAQRDRPRADRGPGRRRPRSRSGPRAGSRRSTTASPTSTPTSTTTCATACARSPASPRRRSTGAATRPAPGSSSRRGCSSRSPRRPSANFVWATQRARWLARQVADALRRRSARRSCPRCAPRRRAALGAVREMKLSASGETFAFGQQALTGLRGGYIGMLMFGMLGTIVGLRLLNPFSIGAGPAARRQDDQRRAQAPRRRPPAGRGEDGGAPLRRRRDASRSARTPATCCAACSATCATTSPTLAEQLTRSLKESLTAAGALGEGVEGGPRAPLAEIDTELARLETLQARVGPCCRTRAERAAAGGRGAMTAVHAVGPGRLSVMARRRAGPGGRGVPARPRGLAAGWPSSSRRLDEPLRVAIAGKVKAGKSTLLNALVGEQIAPDRRGRVHPDRHLVPRRRG